MKEKVLVIGGTGLVGSHFVEKSYDFKILAPSTSELNLQNEQSIANYLQEHNPDWIINFAAYTDVNGAENQRGDESGLCWQINVDGVSSLLKNYKSNNFIQISTDMVFEGSKENPGPYDENSKPPENYDNLTWYGWSKNRGEKLVLDRGGTVVRIIYPVRANFAGKLDYIRGPLFKIASGKMHPLFSDQQISITYINELTQALKTIIAGDHHGIFHVSSDTTNPFDLISKVLSEIGEDPQQLKPSSVVEFLKTQGPAYRYPLYGGLKSKQTEEILDLHFSTWQTVVENLVGEGLKLPVIN
ncbi:hypothetical protein A2572_04630 [Candidatus Collierbacteria bacterium RIFOXYD1_FULL_40_9]|uniref:dTDP-4-dehydrorhamnose reductase n=1 Tax=Candidatus Collierbacteria bacterium RIFOXYD1_FULL_40_9 TaxID=1817731 RepID=A0A1F5FUU4_9BACT|nr:MAG: hypothetical protein A2572_04630 [Candidatus Collierbacteria bacterium RIFOXYD1_FULL_40_9]